MTDPASDEHHRGRNEVKKKQVTLALLAWIPNCLVSAQEGEADDTQ